MNDSLQRMKWALDQLELLKPSNPLTCLSLMTEEYHATVTQQSFQDGLQRLQEFQDVLVENSIIHDQPVDSSVVSPVGNASSDNIQSTRDESRMTEKSSTIPASIPPRTASISMCSVKLSRQSTSDPSDSVYSVAGGTGWQFIVKANGKISRPPNAFILYRFEKHQELWSEYKAKRQEDPNRGNNSFSTILGKMWKDEPASVKQYYTEKAKQVKKEHAQLFPNYKYMPGVHCPEQAKTLSKKRSRFIQSMHTPESEDEYLCVVKNKKIKQETLIPPSPPMTPCSESQPLDRLDFNSKPSSTSLETDALDMLCLFS